MKRSAILIVCFFALVTTVFAGGFQVNLQGQKQNGMGGCGAGLMIDASNVFFNPGALSLQERSSVAIGVSPVFGRITYREAAPGTYTTNNVPAVSTPFYAYFNYRLKGAADRWSVGLGVNTPFGSSLTWEDDWKYAALVKNISLTTIYAQPTIAFKISDKLGIGAGFVLGYGNVAISKAVPAQDPTGAFGNAELSGNDIGFGANAGIYFTPNDKLSIGLNYRSPVRFLAVGDANFTVAPSLAEFFPNTTFEADITLPQNIVLGIGYKPTENLRLTTDIQFVGWSSYDSLNFIFADTTEKLQYQYNQRLLKDAFIFRLGAEYFVNPNLTVRAGASYDMSPIPDERIIPDTPDADKIAISAGVTYTLADQLDLDASCIFVEVFQRSGENIDNGFAGTYRARALVPGIGLTWHFGGQPKVAEFVDPTFE